MSKDYDRRERKREEAKGGVMVHRERFDNKTSLATASGGQMVSGWTDNEPNNERGKILFVNQLDPCRILEQVNRKSIIYYELNKQPASLDPRFLFSLVLITTSTPLTFLSPSLQ